MLQTRIRTKTYHGWRMQDAIEHAATRDDVTLEFGDRGRAYLVSYKGRLQVSQRGADYFNDLKEELKP